jgi:hypothetical protein
MPHRSHREIVNSFGHVSLAEDLGLPPRTVKQWRTRDRIPSEYFFEVIQAAKRRSIAGVTHEALHRLMIRRKPGRSAAQRTFNLQVAE